MIIYVQNQARSAINIELCVYSRSVRQIAVYLNPELKYSTKHSTEIMSLFYDILFTLYHRCFMFHVSFYVSFY